MNRSDHPLSGARFKPRLLAMAVATAFSTPLIAASADETSVSDRVQAQGDLVIYNNTYRNTATKTALSAEETPQGYSIVDQADLDMRNADSVAEALRYSTGVNTELRGGAVTRLDLFSIRGFINYQNAYDGLPLIFNDWNLQPQIDAKVLEQVEVFKGPTSTLYGSMPPGGMVNLISKQPQTESAHSVELATGSRNKIEASFDSAGQIGESDFSYRVVGLASEEDSQADTAQDKRTLIAPSIDWQVSEDTLVNFNLYYQDDPAMGVYTTLPAEGMFRDNPNGEFDQGSFSGDKNWNAYEREVTLVGYKINHQLNDNWTVLQNVRYMDASAYQENTYISSLEDDMRTLNRNAYLTDETSKAIALDNQLSGIVYTGDVEHNLLVGLDYQKLKSDIRYEDQAIATLDLFDRDNDQLDRATLDMTNTAYSSDFTKETEQTGFYLQDQMKVGSLVLIAGARYDDYKGTEKGKKYSQETDTKLTETHTTGRVGALYQLGNGLAPFVSYAESYQPETGVTRNKEAFEASTGQQWEAGIKYKSADRQVTGSLVAYQITKDNVPTRDPNGSAYDLIQAGEVESKGIEAELQAQISDNLLVSAYYTRQDVEITKDNNGLQGKTPVWVPEQMLSAWAQYDIYTGSLAGTTLSSGIRHIGEAQMDAANSDTVPSATMMDLSVAYDLAGLSPDAYGATARISVSNVFDEASYTCYDGNNCWFGAERTVEASLKYDF
ncbi:TonB-dependent siderophore receptor [Oceanospirillum sp.]|uniref:TonB-dependent siderophore receptor n=1 Tax=Oceanospirillum sp. TaxID=2021254 RepID=UPI003A957D98